MVMANLGSTSTVPRVQVTCVLPVYPGNLAASSGFTGDVSDNAQVVPRECFPVALTVPAVSGLVMIVGIINNNAIHTISFIPFVVLINYHQYHALPWLLHDADPIESEWETDSIYVLIDAAQIDEALGSFNYGASLSD